MTNSENARLSTPVTVLKWIARFTGSASFGLLTLFVASLIATGEMKPESSEGIGLICFPGGVMLGFAVAMWREKTGATIAMVGCATFYLWHFLDSGDLPDGIYFLLFTSPAVLFLISGWLRGSSVGREATSS
jgi:hypothetical protein